MAGYRFVIRQDLKPKIEANLGWNVVFSKGVWIFTGILTFSMTPSHSNLPEPDKLTDAKVGHLLCLSNWISVSHLMTVLFGMRTTARAH